MATFNPQIEEFQREINSLKLHLNSESKNKKKKGNSRGKKKQTIETITTLQKCGKLAMIYDNMYMSITSATNDVYVISFLF
jgi:hypothetical protein